MILARFSNHYRLVQNALPSVIMYTFQKNQIKSESGCPKGHNSLFWIYRYNGRTGPEFELVQKFMPRLLSISFKNSDKSHKTIHNAKFFLTIQGHIYSAKIKSIQAKLFMLE